MQTYLVWKKSWMPHHVMIEDEAITEACEEEIEQVNTDGGDYGQGEELT